MLTLRPDLVVIPCGARKLRHPSPAGKLYTGPYFRSCQRAAVALRPRHGYLILSALHGFVQPTTVLAPYDKRMGQPGAVAPARLADQAHALNLDHLVNVIVFGGRDYVAATRLVWTRAVAPVVGGMGVQRHRLGVIAQRGHL